MTATEELIAADKQFIWHPFTNMREWCSPEHEPLVLVEGPAAIELARAIVDLFPRNTLTRVFYSDDGSTGIEVALRIADQYWRLRNSRRHQFIAFKSGYHGDTAGAASLGAAPMFQIEPSPWNFPAIQVPNVAALQALSPAEVAKVRAVVMKPPGCGFDRLIPCGLFGNGATGRTRYSSPTKL